MFKFTSPLFIFFINYINFDILTRYVYSFVCAFDYSYKLNLLLFLHKFRLYITRYILDIGLQEQQIMSIYTIYNTYIIPHQVYWNQLGIENDTSYQPTEFNSILNLFFIWRLYFCMCLDYIINIMVHIILQLKTLGHAQNPKGH